MRWPFAIACLALAGPAAAQTPASQLPSFKAGVELVRLDVRVTDRDGRPVRDIRQDEIEVVEDGQRRPVVFFRHIEEPTESYADVLRHTVAGEVSTNQGAARGHLYVLVFDQQHISLGNEQRVRLAAERFLETRMHQGDRVALYAVPGPGPRIPFTGDVRRVTRELATVRGLAGGTDGIGPLAEMRIDEAYQIVRGNEQILARVADRVETASPASDIKKAKDSALPLDAIVKEDAGAIVNRTDSETRRTLAMLAEVVREMRAIEGRKTVLLMSEGFYADNVTRELDDVAAAAAESYSVIYGLDLNRRIPDIADNELIGGDLATGILDKINPLGSLAVATGGLLVNDAGAHAEQIFRALGDESQDYYLVGFEALETARRNPRAYHRVTVKVGRDAVRTSTRTGFTLADPAARLNRRDGIDRALAAPFPQQGLPVHYTTYVLRGSAGAERVILSLAAELPIESAQQPRPADVVFVVRSARDGHIAASGTDVIALPARPDNGSSTGAGTYRVQFELPAGDYVMRAAVREPGGVIGSADRRFTVHALDGPAVTSGDLVISAQRGELPVRPVAYTGDVLSGVLDVYGRSIEQLARARVTFELAEVGEPGSTTSGEADLEDARMLAGGGAARTARMDVPLQGLASGNYIVRAKVNVGADTVAEVVRDVEVRQGRRPADRVEARVEAFDPREVVNGAFAKEYATALTHLEPVAADGLRGLNRLGASDYPQAIAAFHTALDAASGAGGRDAARVRAASAFFLGWSYHGAGDDRQAISAWRRAAFEDPTAVPAHLALADIYERLAQPALAVQALRAGLAALPQSPEILDRLSRLERR